MKLVLTGALGHIGSFLIRGLPVIFPHCRIVIIDNFATQRYASLFGLPNTATYELVDIDVSKVSIDTHLKDADCVIHLAALTDAASSFGREQLIEQVNLGATENVATAAAKMRVPAIFASSTSVYGTTNGSVDETCKMSDLKPQSPYAVTKLKEEVFISSQVVDAGLNASILRFGTIFGISPGMRFHTAVNKFCFQAANKQPLTVWTTAFDQKRPYLGLNDCLRAVQLIIENASFDGNVSNVVSINATVRDVVGAIQKHAKGLQVNFVDHKIMNQLSYEVLNTRISKLGFEPTDTLEQGVAETMGQLQGLIGE